MLMCMSPPRVTCTQEMDAQIIGTSARGLLAGIASYEHAYLASETS